MIIFSVLKTLIYPDRNVLTKTIKLKLTLFFFVALLTSFTPAKSQILKDSASIKLVKRGIDYVYNFQFSSAEKVKQEMTKLQADNEKILAEARL